MTQVGEAFVSIKADTKDFQVDVEKGVKVGLDAARRDVDRFEKDMRAAFDSVAERMKSIGDSATEFGKSASVGLTLPIVGVGTAMFRAAGDFEASMNQVRAVTGATGSEFEALSAQAQELGATTKFSAGEAAQAMGFLGMAGFDTSEIIGAMPSVLQLAAAANMDIATSADIASNILAGYALSTADLAAVNDALVKTTVATNTELIGVGEAMKYVGPVAQSAGVGINETAAAIGLLGNAGIQGSMAGTTLRGVISNLLTTSGPAADVIERLGLVTTDSAGNFIGLIEVVQQLEKSGASTADLMTIFGDRAGPGMAALLSQGSEALIALTGELDNSGGIAEQIATIQMEGLKGAMDELSSAVEGLFIAMAESGLMAAFVGVIQRLTELVAALSTASPELMKFVGIVAGILAIVGPTALVIGKLTSAIAGTIVAAQKAAAALSTFIATATTAQLAMGGIGLALGAIAGAWLLFSGGSDKATDSMQRTEEQTKRLTAALNSLEGVTPTLTDEILRMAETSPNLRDAMIRLGVDVTDVAEAFAAGGTAASDMIARLAATQDGLGISIDRSKILAGELQGLAQALSVANRNAAELAKIVPEGVEGQRLLGIAVEETTVSLDDQARAAAEDAKALDDLLNATLNAFRSQFDFERVLGEVARVFIDYRDAIAKGTISGQALLDVQDELTLSALDVADAAVATAEQMAAAQGKTLDASQAAAIYIEELRRFAQVLSPSDPVRKNLEALISTIETRLPRSVNIHIAADTRPAMSAIDSLSQSFDYALGTILYGTQKTFEDLALPIGQQGRRAGALYADEASKGVKEETPAVVESAEELVSKMNAAMERAMESFGQVVRDRLDATQKAFDDAWSAIDARLAKDSATRRVTESEKALAAAQADVRRLTNEIAAGERAIIDARNERARVAQTVTQAEFGVADAMRFLQITTQGVEAATRSLTDAQGAAALEQQRVAAAQAEVAAAKRAVTAATEAAKNAANDEKVANQQLSDAQKALDTAKRRRDLAGVVRAQQAVAAAEEEVARRQEASALAADEVTRAQEGEESAATALTAAQEVLRAAQDRVKDSQEALRIAKDADRASTDALRLAQQALTQTQREAEQASRAVSEAENNLTRTKNDLANAQRSVVTQTQALRDANVTLLKASEDLLEQGPKGEANFRKIATAAGLEKAEIDKLVKGYRDLEKARKDAAAAAEAQIKFERELAATKGATAIDSTVKALQNKMWEIQQMPRGADSSAAQRQAATLAVTAAEAYADAAAGRGTPAWNTVFKNSLGYFLNAYPMISDELSGIRRAIGLANGGIVSSPTFANIAEGGRPEVVIPLTRPRRALDLMEQSGLANLALQAGIGGGGPLITMTDVKIAGPTDADLVAQRVNSAVRTRLVL